MSIRVLWTLDDPNYLNQYYENFYYYDQRIALEKILLNNEIHEQHMECEKYLHDCVNMWHDDEDDEDGYLD